LPPIAAADKLPWLIAETPQLQLTGIGLKDEQTVALPQTATCQDAALHD
jgi:hypothetical protein